MERAKQEALEYIGQRSDLLFDMSDRIWEHPEVGFTENYAARLFSETLEKEGFTVEQGVGDIPTSVVGTFGSGGPVIGFLGEFDALPGLSQEAGLAEKKPLVKEGPGHGCGTTCWAQRVCRCAGPEALSGGKPSPRHREVLRLPGGGRRFRQGLHGQGRRVQWDGCRLLLAPRHREQRRHREHHGQLSGVLPLLRHLVPRGHVAGAGAERTGCPGTDEQRRAVPAGAHSHQHPGALRHYQRGGNAPGIVQAYAEGLYLMRAPQLPQVKELYERVNRIAQGAAMMTDTRVEIEFIKACSNTVLNTELLKLMQKNMEQLPPVQYDEDDLAFARALQATNPVGHSYFDTLAADVTDPAEKARLEADKNSPIHGVVMPYPPERQGFVSSDVGDVSWVCPLAQINGTTMPADTAMHTWQMVSVGKSPMAKKGMLFAGRVMAACGIDCLEDPDILRRAKEEKDRRTRRAQLRPAHSAGGNAPHPQRERLNNRQKRADAFTGRNKCRSLTKC